MLRRSEQLLPLTTAEHRWDILMYITWYMNKNLFLLNEAIDMAFMIVHSAEIDVCVWHYTLSVVHARKEVGR